MNTTIHVGYISTVPEGVDETVILYLDVTGEHDTTTHYLYLTPEQVQEIVAIDLAAQLTR